MQPLDCLSQQDIQDGLKNLRSTLQRGRLPFVILVEDDDTDASLFRHALKRGGVSVEYMRFYDGKQALDFFHGRGSFADRDMFPLPKLTVLDWNLPRSSGLEILEEIRSDPHLDQLIVIALTSSEDIHQLEKARCLKINDWIHKPQDLHELVEIVQQIKRSWLNEAS